MRTTNVARGPSHCDKMQSPLRELTAMSNKTRPADPSQAQLQRQLGATYKLLQSFLADNGELKPEWKYYGEKYGWSLKLFAGKRNICFINPYDGYFGIAFVLAERTVEAALAARLPRAVKEQITNARVYVEGRGVRFEIRSAKDLVPAQKLLAIKRAN